MLRRGERGSRLFQKQEKSFVWDQCAGTSPGKKWQMLPWDFCFSVTTMIHPSGTGVCSFHSPFCVSFLTTQSSIFTNECMPVCVRARCLHGSSANGGLQHCFWESFPASFRLLLFKHYFLFQRKLHWMCKYMFFYANSFLYVRACGMKSKQKSNTKMRSGCPDLHHSLGV